MLSDDPYNRSGQYQIKKLVDVRPEDGNLRLRLARWRVRFSMREQEVVIHDMGLRREDTH
jgi:hypothetical protein